MLQRDRNFSFLFFFCFVGEEVKEVKRRGEEKVRPRIARTSRPRNLEDARQTHESADSSLPTHQRLAECEVKARVKRSRKEKQETKQKNTSRFASRREEEEEQEEEEEEKKKYEKRPRTISRTNRLYICVLDVRRRRFSFFAVGFRFRVVFLPPLLFLRHLTYILRRGTKKDDVFFFLSCCFDIRVFFL